MDKINQKVPSQPQSVQEGIGSRESNSDLLKTLSIGLGVIGIGIIIGIGGYLLGSKQSQPVVQNSVQVTPSPTPDPTANWKTYRNEKFGFEVKYPSNYLIKERAGRREGGLTYTLGALDIYKQQDKSFITIFVVGPNFVLGTRDWEDFSLGEIKGSIAYNWNDWELRDKVSSSEIEFKSGNKHFLITTQGDPSKDKTINQILSTFRFVEQKDLNTSCINEPEGAPVITSISPTSGLIGTKIEIRGCNLSGFEGDLDAVLVRNDGAKIPLFGGLWHSMYGYTEEEYGKLIRVTLQSYCESGYETGRYSGITSPCEKVEATPGVYRVYVTAWGKKSNEINFKIE